MKKTIIISAALAVAVFFASCAGVITLKTPQITGGKAAEKAYVPKKPPVKFEDFEAGVIVGGYSYANQAGGASAKVMASDPSTDKAYMGNYSAKAVYNTGTNSDWGCGFGFQSVYGGGYIDAKDREYVELW
ncbi:MAG TPA: hypothetical protein P5511_05350, partial [Candidatus Goldiibacteriota bacterium]|nr:hypothetical protein [Candidatus Goldiibacteriota bacterium]